MVPLFEYKFVKKSSFVKRQLINTHFNILFYYSSTHCDEINIETFFFNTAIFVEMALSKHIQKFYYIREQIEHSKRVMKKI